MAERHDSGVDLILVFSVRPTLGFFEKIIDPAPGGQPDIAAMLDRVLSEATNGGRMKAAVNAPRNVRRVTRATTAATTTTAASSKKNDLDVGHSPGDPLARPGEMVV